MLNKFLLFVTFLLITESQITAQTMSAGPIVGINFSTIRGEDNTSFKPGFSVGGVLTHSINDKSGLNAKVLFSQFGTKFDNSDNEIRFNYVHIPVSFVYFFGKLGDKFRPKLFAGPYVGFLMKATDQDGDEILNSNSESPFNAIDLGGQIGAGVNVKVGDRTWLNFDAGLIGGLFNLKNSDSIKNFAYNVNVGVAFPIGK